MKPYACGAIVDGKRCVYTCDTPEELATHAHIFVAPTPLCLYCQHPWVGEGHPLHGPGICVDPLPPPEPARPEPRQAVAPVIRSMPSGHVIVEIAVSTERTTRLREFENRKVFISAKALILPGVGVPDTVQAELFAEVNRWADAEEARVRGVPTPPHSSPSAPTAPHHADSPTPERAGPSIPAPERPGPSTRADDPGAGLRDDGKGQAGSDQTPSDGLRLASTPPPPPQSSAGPQPARDAARAASPSPGRCPVHGKPFRVPLKSDPYCATPTKKQGDKVVEWCPEKPRKAGVR